MYSHLTPAVALERIDEDLHRAALARLSRPAEHAGANRRRARVRWLARDVNRAGRPARA